MHNPIDIYIELLDEGTETWCSTQARDVGNGLFKLLTPADYDPETEFWDFLPGSEVRLEQKTDTRYVSLMPLPKHNAPILLARHPNPEAIRVWVESTEEYAPQMRATYALPEGNGRYRLLPTPHYTPAQQWRFLPGSLVRLKKEKDVYGGEYYLVI